MSVKKPEEAKTPETEEMSDTPETEEMSGTSEQKKNMVKITLFKDNKDYKDDLFVSVNGERFQIQRGVEVEVPDYVAEVIRNSIAQDIIAADTAKELKE